jgi:hypothetical protein
MDAEAPRHHAQSMVITPTITHMGISIQFDMALPGSTSRADALALLHRLQDFAALQHPANITPVIALTRGELQGDLDPVSLEWMLAVFEEVMGSAKHNTRRT